MKILFFVYLVGAAFTWFFMVQPIVCVFIALAVVAYMVGLWYHYYKLKRQ